MFVSIAARKYATCQLFEHTEFVCIRYIQTVFGEPKLIDRIDRHDEKETETFDHCYDGHQQQMYCV